MSHRSQILFNAKSADGQSAVADVRGGRDVKVSILGANTAVGTIAIHHRPSKASQGDEDAWPMVPHTSEFTADGNTTIDMGGGYSDLKAVLSGYTTGDFTVIVTWEKD